MSISEQTPRVMIAAIVGFAVTTYMASVYLGPATGLSFVALATLIMVLPEKVIQVHSRRQIKEGMISVSTLVILGYTLICLFGVLIAIYSLVAMLNAHFGV